MSALSVACPSCRTAFAPPATSCPACGVPLPDATGEFASQPQADTAPDAGPARPAAADESPFLSPPQRPDEIGRLGPYRLLGRLGAGGMGAVFRAEDPHLKRQVAVKVMLPQFAADPAARARFLREARAQAAVEHDHVAAIHQVGEDNGVPFLAMPLLKGLSLADALKATPRPPVAEVVRVAREIARGLAAAHDTGLVHRDIKPANVWLEGADRRVKLLDFGLARPAGPAEATADADDPVTQTGVAVGTPAYMSPEQARGLPLDGRTDLFSLGCVLYQMLTGRRPFVAASAAGVLIAVATETPPRPAELAPAVPPALDDLTMRLLAKAPADRPASAAATAAELLGIETTLGLTGTVVVPVPALAAADPFADLDPTEPASAAGPVKKKSPPWLLIGSVVAFAVVAVVAAQVVIKIKNKDGTETEVKVPKDATVTVTKDGKEVAKIGPKDATATKDGKEVGKVGPKLVSADRAAAEWVLATKGAVAIVVDGEVRYLDKGRLPNECFKLVNIHFAGPVAIADADLSRLRDLDSLAVLDLYYPNGDGEAVTDAMLDHLKEMKSLRKLSLHGTAAGESRKVYQLLKAWPKLETLSVQGTPTDEDFALLGAHPTLADYRHPDCDRISEQGWLSVKPLKLRSLAFSNGTISERVAEMLAQKSDLQDFATNATISEAAWKHLRLENLTRLGTNDGPSVNDAACQYVRQFSKLQRWDCNNPTISDVGAAAMRGHPELVTWALGNTKVTDASIPVFSTLPKLADLNLSKTAITPAGFEKLKAALPKCRIVTDHGTYEPK